MTIEVPVKQQKPRRLMVWPGMERSIDRLMRFTPFAFRRWPGIWPTEEGLPDIDVFERDGKLFVRVDVPGMRVEDIEVTVDGDMLTVRGKREEEKEVKEKDYYCSERSYGEFTRTIRLPEEVSPDEVDAHYENGVLEVAVPRPAALETKPVKVPIK